MSYNPLARTIAFSRAMHQESVVVPIYKQTAGEYPVPSFDELTSVIARDQDLFTSICFIRNRALSRGFKAKCDGNAPNYFRTEAEEFLEDWSEAVRWGDAINERGYKVLAKDLFFEQVGLGTSIVEKINDDYDRFVALAHVQASSIWRYQRDEYGNLVYIWQLPTHNPRPLTPSRYIVWAWNRMNREPFGRGISHPLTTWRSGADGTLMWPPIYRWWQMQDSIARKMQRYGNPHTIFTLKAASREEASAASQYLRDPAADTSYVTDFDTSAVSDSPQAGRMNIGPDLDWWTQRFQAGLGTAVVKLLTESDNNRAGSQVKTEIEDILIWDAKDAFANTTDFEIYYPVLQQNGFDAPSLRPHLTYNMPDDPEEYTFADLIKAATPDPTTGQALITPQEFRRNAKHWGWDVDDDPDMTTAPGNLQTPANQVVPNMPLPALQAFERKAKAALW